jgi:hypothetical protein
MRTDDGSITTEQALERGFWMVKLPSMALMFGPWLAFVLLADKEHSTGSKGFALFLPAFLGGFVLGWLAWSILIPRWRLWAYQRVTNIEELKVHGAIAQLIWLEGHFFERTEIASNAIRQKLKALENQKRLSKQFSPDSP